MEKPSSGSPTDPVCSGSLGELRNLSELLLTCQRRVILRGFSLGPSEIRLGGRPATERPPTSISSLALPFPERPHDTPLSHPNGHACICL